MKLLLASLLIILGISCTTIPEVKVVVVTRHKVPNFTECGDPKKAVPIIPADNTTLTEKQRLEIIKDNTLLYQASETNFEFYVKCTRIIVEKLQKELDEINAVEEALRKKQIQDAQNPK